MPEQNYNIAIQTTGDTTGAVKVEQSLTKVSSAVTQSGVSMRNTGMLANNIGYQLQDFAVQVGMGTSALRAFAQQAPQAISALTMAGVVTGNWSIALSAIAVAIPVTVMGMQLLGDESEKTAKKVSSVVDEMVKVRSDKLDDAADAMDDAADAAKKLAAEFPLAQKAQNDWAAASLSNAEKMVQAQRNIAEALGIQVDHVRELEEAEARAAAKRAFDAEQAIAALRKQQAEAIKLVQERADAEERIRQDIENRQAAFEDRKAKLNENRARKANAEQILATAPNAANFGAGFGEIPTAAFVQDESAIAAAKTFLSDPKLEKRIELGEKEVNRLAATIKALERKLAKAEVDTQAAANDAEDTANAVAVNIDALEQTLNADNTLAKSKLLLEKGKQIAADVDEVIANFQPVEGAGRTAIASLKTATANRVIDAKEIAQSAADLRQINTILARGLGKSTNVQEMSVQSVNELLRRIVTLENDYINLRGKMGSLNSRTP